MPAAFRLPRTTSIALSISSYSFSKPTALAIWKSVKPSHFALYNNSFERLLMLPQAFIARFVWKIRSSLWRNHRSILVNSWISSTLIPSKNAFSMTKMRLSVGAERLCRISSIVISLLPTKPWRPCPIILIPFWMASSNVLPMAITSPTDFILEPNSRVTPWNLPKSQRGILQTT